MENARQILEFGRQIFSNFDKTYIHAGGGGANTEVPDMYGGGGVFSGPKTQK